MDPRLPNYAPASDSPAVSRAPDHTAEVVVPAAAPVEVELHLGAGPDLTACGQPRDNLQVTDAPGVFREAKGGRLHSHRRVCPTCESRSVGGPMR